MSESIIQRRRKRSCSCRCFRILYIFFCVNTNKMMRWFVLLLFIVILMVIYVYVEYHYSYIPKIIREQFIGKGPWDNYQLVSPQTLALYQGNSLPLIPPESVLFDQTDNAMVEVDGEFNSPKSLFEYTYNQCKPECCGYSSTGCSGGCVCYTPKQINYISSRGSQKHETKCSYKRDNEY